MSVQTIYGRIGKDGKMLVGTGFKAERMSIGLYKITFAKKFRQPPAVVATQNNYPSFPDQDPSDGAVVGNIKTDSCQVVTGNVNHQKEDRELAFIAIGERGLEKA